jgi:hypothetical protein
MDPIDLANRFDYHPPQTPERAKAHENVREIMRQAAIGVESYCADGREKALAIKYWNTTDLG